MLVFLHDGRVEMDSNFVENRIRPVKLTAKNALFAGHDEGARAWGRIASLIETCKEASYSLCAELRLPGSSEPAPPTLPPPGEGSPPSPHWS